MISRRRYLDKLLAYLCGGVTARPAVLAHANSSLMESSAASATSRTWLSRDNSLAE